MDTKIGKISSVKRVVDSSIPSLAKSLSDRGLNRQEGTFRLIGPYKEKGGLYRTGLDENAVYIREMELKNPEEAKQERALVKSFKAKAQSLLANVSLEPDSTFYSDMTKRWGDDSVCQFAKMRDGDNLYMLEDPYQLVVYAYLRVHPKIAPSGEALGSGKYTDAEYYVNDGDIETKRAFNKKNQIFKAIAVLDGMSDDKKLVVARQCGLPVKEHSSKEEVFNLLADYIDASKIAKTQDNVVTFMKFADMKEDLLDIRNTVDLAISHNVIRKSKEGYYNGDQSIGRTKPDVINYYTDINNQGDLLAIKESIKLKKIAKSRVA